MVTILTFGAPDNFGKDAQGEVNLIPCDAIRITGGSHREVDDGAVEEMRQSIEANGLIAPVGVKYSKMGGYDLIYGRHRLIAWKSKFQEGLDKNDEALLKRWHQIPACVYDTNMSDEAILLLELSENLVRNDLTKKEKQKFWGKMLLARKNFMPKVKQPKITQEMFGKAIGIEKSASAQVSKLWKKFTKEKKLNGVKFPQPDNPQYKKFFDWLVKKKHVKGEFLKEIPFTTELQVSCPLGIKVAPKKRTFKEIAELIKMPRQSLERRWREFNRIFKEPHNFQTCHEFIINDFAEWLENYDVRKIKEEEEVSTEEIYNKLLKLCNDLEKKGKKISVIEMAIQKLLDRYKK